MTFATAMLALSIIPLENKRLLYSNPDDSVFFDFMEIEGIELMNTSEYFCQRFVL